MGMRSAGCGRLPGCKRAIIVAAMFCLAAGAQAQQAADRVRIAYSDPIQTTLVYNDQKPETSIVSRAVYDSLICYDPKKREFEPVLASSWQHIDARTLEFRLRDDVLFHDGGRFSADDVVYTLNWAINPASKLRFAPQSNNLGWIDRVEKIDDLTVRVIAKEPTPFDLTALASFGAVVSSRLHAALPNKDDYGRFPAIGTGPYKVVSFDSARGIELERNPNYRSRASCRPAATAQRIHITQIPDYQTQIAQMLVGGVDFIWAKAKDVVENLGANPALAVSTIEDNAIQTLMFDAAGRSGKAPLQMLAVREAITRAIDAQTIARSVMAGGDGIKKANALCTDGETGCAWSKPWPAYDPKKARELLTGAGFAAGLDIEVTALAGSHELGEAIAGELRKVGIRSSVDKATFAAFRRKQTDGKLQLLVLSIGVANLGDASTFPTYYFEDSPRNYTGDPKMNAFHLAAVSEMDPQKRRDIFRTMSDYNAEHLLVLPLVSTPEVYVHQASLMLRKDIHHNAVLDLVDLSWKK